MIFFWENIPFCEHKFNAIELLWMDFLAYTVSWQEDSHITHHLMLLNRV